MSDSSMATGALGTLSELLASCDATADSIGWPPPELRHEYHRHIMMLIAQAYVQLFSTRIEHPEWIPHTGALFPWGAPNHDTIYAFAPIDARATYRVSGTQGSETIATLMLRRGGPNTGQVHGAPLAEFDVNRLSPGDDGRFELIISAEKPAGCSAHWFALHPETTGIVSRHVTVEPMQRDGAWSIERLDRTPGPAVFTAGEIAQSTRNAVAFVAALNTLLITLVKRLRDNTMNSFVAERFAQTGGIADQMYFQGAWELAEDEALILESDIPETVHYWSVQLLDAFYDGIEAVNHASALNHAQSRIDNDGKVRFVVCAGDPGVANWLDTGAWPCGAMLWRWHSANRFPEPTARRVKRSQMHLHLPPDTARVTPEQRAAMRAARIHHYQTRRRW
jgi:Protein of unknown function (DUF1214)